MTERRKLKKNYKLLTALRALGFVGVMLFHRFSHLFPGGYLAVIIFLVLSGFLTMRGADGKSQSGMKSFINKFIKLMGPVYFMMAMVMVFSLFFAREIFDDSIKSALPVALNFENIARIFSNADYFNRLGNFNIFNHMWYVSLYMQFILIFEIINHFTNKLSDNIKIAIYGLITILSFLVIFRLADREADISRIYYGIDTRISAFSLGVVLYLIDKKFTGRFLKTKGFLSLVASISLVLIIIPFFTLKGSEYGSYKWRFIIYTIIVGLLIVSLYNLEDRYLVIPKNSFRISTYLGERSYQLYLWQYVVQILIVYFLRDSSIFLTIAIEFGLLLVFAEINYQLFRNKNINLFLMVIAAVVLVILSITGLIIGNAKEKEIAELRSEITANEEDIKRRNEEAMNKAASQTKARTASENDIYDKYDKVDGEPVETEDIEIITESEEEPEEIIEEELPFVEKAYDDFDFTDNELAYLTNLSVTAVGDSVIINADSYIRNFIPNFYLDGEVGRDMVDGPNILSQVANNVGLGDIIVISLGSNGSANAPDMDAIMHIANGRDVYFVNTSHTQPYMDFVNRNIREYCEGHDNAHMVDWRGYIKDKPDYLAADRTHPNIPGSDAFAKLIMRKILNVNKVAP